MLYKRIILFGGLLLILGTFCFSQELRVVNTLYNGRISDSEPENQYPQNPQVKGQWDRWFERYNLVPIERNEFNNRDLWNRIATLSRQAVVAGLGETYSVFLRMDDRRFICLLRWSNNRLDYVWHWIYEIKT